MLAFMSGAITMGFMIAGLFFLRFRQRTADSLFLYFGISFWLLAAGQLLSTMIETPNEGQSWIYLLRLCAFVVLIIGIVSKNLGQSRSGDTLKDR